MRDLYRSFTRSPSRGAVEAAAQPRYWLKSNTGYVSLSAVLGGTSNWAFGCKIYAPNAAGAGITLASYGSNGIYLRDSNHATLSNNISLVTSLATHEFVDAYNGVDRSVSHDVEIVCVADVATLYIDGVAVDSKTGVTGAFRANRFFTSTTSGAVIGNIDYSGVNIFRCDEGSGVPTDSEGSVVCSYTGSPTPTWVYGLSPEVAV